MATLLQPRRTKQKAALACLYAAAIVGAVASLDIATAQQPDAPTSGASALVGRWTGTGFVHGAVLPVPGPHVTIEFVACGEGICGRQVKTDGSCTAVILELASAGAGKEASRRTDHQDTFHGGATAFDFSGKLSVERRPHLAITARLQADQPGVPRIVLREAERPVLSRRLADALALTLERTGPPACAQQRVS
jgi:hypothetical protein